MTDWVEIIVPVGAADVDDVAALVAALLGASGGCENFGGDQRCDIIDVSGTDRYDNFCPARLGHACHL